MMVTIAMRISLLHLQASRTKSGRRMIRTGQAMGPKIMRRAQRRADLPRWLLKLDQPSRKTSFAISL